jgi:hypothetical protein
MMKKGLFWMLIPVFATILVGAATFWGATQVVYDVSGMAVKIFLMIVAGMLVWKLVLPMLEKSLIKHEKVSMPTMVIISLIAGGLLFFGLVGVPLSTTGSATITVGDGQYNLLGLAFVGLLIAIYLNRKK